MSLAAKMRRAPGRIVTGAFILNSGIGKLSADEETAKGIHGMATGAYPALQRVEHKMFLRGLGIAETSLGTALLLPIVPARLAGAGLVAFSGGLLGMWWRTEGMHEPGSVRPTPAGIAIAKDAWMFAIGTNLLIDSTMSEAGKSRAVRKAERRAAKSERKVERRTELVHRRAELGERASATKAQAKAAAKERAHAARTAAKSAAKQQTKSARHTAKAARAGAKPYAGAARSAASNAADSARSLAGEAGESARSAMSTARDAVGSAASSAGEAAAQSVHDVSDRVRG